MKRLLTIAVLMAVGSVLAAAQFVSRALPIDNVMNSQQIRSITQDRKGFLWMGSGSGLYRYDGYSYQKITEVRNPDLLPEQAVQKVIQWGSRYLWITLRGELYACYDTDGERFVDWSGSGANQVTYRRFVIADERNLWLYDQKNGCCHVSIDQDGRFKSERFTEESHTLPSNHITFVAQEKDGKGWIGTDRGLVRVHEGNTRIVIKNQAMACAQQMPDGTICFLTEEGSIFQTHKSGSLNIFTPSAPLPYKVKRVAREGQQLIIATAGPTYCYDIRQHTMEPHPTIHINDAQVVEDNRGNKVVFDYDGTDLWYITPEETFHLHDIYSKELVRQHGGGRFMFVYGSRGRIWISTYSNGLFAYNRQTEQMTHYMPEGRTGELITSKYLHNIFEDHSGQLWICQENMGVRCIATINDMSSTYFFTDASDKGHANTVRLIEPVGDKILVANRENALWTTNSRLEVERRDNPYQDDVVSATTDHQGRLWVGTRNRGIFVDGKPLNPAVKGKVSDILCDRKGRIWISVFNGDVVMVTPGQGDSLQLRYFFQLEHAINQPRSLVLGHDGRIWLCSNEGVYTFQPDLLTKDPSAYQHINVGGMSSKSDEVHCLYEDTKHRIWAGTADHGLAVIDSTGAVVRRYTDADGLPNNRIESIVEDAQGRIWAGTNYGLARYSEADDRFNSFFLSDHPLGLIYTEGCATRLKDGRLAMGTQYGMQVFSPKNIAPRADAFPLALTDIRVNGISLRNIEDGQYDDVISSQKLTLAYDQNSLTFYCSLFDYVTPQQNKYSFLLEHFDKDWSTPSTYNFATYKNLKPGTYVLHIRSYNRYGIQSEHEALLTVVIRQPWWNTWWAWLFYLFFIGAIAWAIWRQWQHNQELQMKIKLENQLTEYKLRFFTNISHEFRTPLTIIRGAMDRISAQGDIPGRLKQPISSMQKSTDRMLRLVNELLEFRKIQNKKLCLSLEEGDIISFLRNIFLTFNETAENHSINYQFTTFAREYKMYFDRNYVDKMAYNLLSNAFKYTPRKGLIVFSVKLTDDGLLTFEVEDTGIGVPLEKQADLFTRFNQSAFSRESIGIGLHMVSELVKVHHGTISYRDNPVGGSIFSITLPTDKSLYRADDFLSSDSLLIAEQDAEQATRPAMTYKEMGRQPINDHLVLVVDDDDDMRDFISGELLHYFNVTVAANGEEALQKLEVRRPHLIVSDVRMPGMSGIELLQKIRQREELSDIPVILLTAITDEEKMVKGTKYGADDYLYKPFNSRVLVAKCAALIAQRDKLRQRYAKEVVGSTPLQDIILEDVDKKFLERFEYWVAQHLDDPNMQFMDFAASMKLGRTTFFKKVKQMTGMSPNEYIRKARMDLAVELLKDPTMSVSEVAFKTGFADQNYFSRSFKEYFGITATQFRKGGQTDADEETKEE